MSEYRNIRNEINEHLKNNRIDLVNQCLNKLDELENKRSLKKILETKGKYRLILENIPIGIIVHGPDSEIIASNTYACNFLGLTPDEIKGKKNIDSAWHFVRPDNTVMPFDEYPAEIVFATGKPIENYITGVYRLKTKDTVWGLVNCNPLFNENDNIIQVITSFIDITEQRKAENALKSSEKQIRKLSAAILQSPTAIVITDLKGDIEFVNPQFTNITGYSYEEAIGKNPRILKSGLTPNEVYSDLWKTITSGKTWKNEVLNKRKDGSLFWEMATIAPIIDENGKIINFIAVKEDITSRKEAEEALLHSQKKLQEANATKDRFFSIIAHDLKNPFNIILGFSDLLLQNHKEYDLETRENVIKTIYDISLKTFNLLENLLAWSRSKSGKIPFNPKNFDIKLIAFDSISLFNEAAEKKNIKVKLLSPDDYSVYADRDMVAATLRNLINNAIKFTPKSGKVNISIKKTDNNFTTITVSDSGIGIRPEKLDIIFSIDRDWSTPGTEDEAGTGLGLFLCKEFVEKNGGKIWVDSKVGKGTNFYFTLPSAKE